jgi:hypothetical protein
MQCLTQQVHHHLPPTNFTVSRPGRGLISIILFFFASDASWSKSPKTAGWASSFFRGDDVPAEDHRTQRRAQQQQGGSKTAHQLPVHMMFKTNYNSKQAVPSQSQR